MITPADMHDLGRKRGVWIPVGEVEAHLLFGWEIVEVVARHERVLMAPPKAQEGVAA